MLNYVTEVDTIVVMLYSNDTTDLKLALADVLNPTLSVLRVEV